MSNQGGNSKYNKRACDRTKAERDDYSERKKTEERGRLANKKARDWDETIGAEADRTGW